MTCIKESPENIPVIPLQEFFHELKSHHSIPNGAETRVWEWIDNADSVIDKLMNNVVEHLNNPENMYEENIYFKGYAIWMVLAKIRHDVLGGLYVKASRVGTHEWVFATEAQCKSLSQFIMQLML